MPEEQEPTWSYNPSENIQTAPTTPSSDTESADTTRSDKPISWTGSEFIENEKDHRWHIYFYLALIASVALVFIFTRDLFSVVAIIIVSILFVVLATRKPRQIPYEINNTGIVVGRQAYTYTEFKSFGLDREGAVNYVNLMPLKRFMPEVSLYYPPDQEDKILKTLALHLPHDQRPERIIDKIIKKIHF